MASALLNGENLRTTWKVSLPSYDVLDGAERKLDWHRERLAVWEKARDQTMVKIRENGVVFDESVLAGDTSSLYSNSGRAPAVTVNSELIRDLNETNSKIAEHKDKVRSFESWCQFLASAEGNLDLTLSDYLYFFGK